MAASQEEGTAEGTLEARASTAAVLIEEDPEEYLLLWADVREAARDEARLAAVRESAAARYDARVRQMGRVGGRDRRRRALTQLFQQQAGAADAAPASAESTGTPESSSGYYLYRAEEREKSIELLRLIFAAGSPEGDLVRRWVAAVGQTVDGALQKYASEGAAGATSAAMETCGAGHFLEQSLE